MPASVAIAIGLGLIGAVVTPLILLSLRVAMRSLTGSDATKHLMRDYKRMMAGPISGLKPGCEYVIASEIFTERLRAGEPLEDGRLWRRCIAEAYVRLGDKIAKEHA